MYITGSFQADNFISIAFSNPVDGVVSAEIQTYTRAVKSCIYTELPEKFLDELKAMLGRYEV